MGYTQRLSKTAFMRGMQCEKSLWLYRHKYDLQDEAPPGQQAIFDKGIEIGILARGLFPAGLDLSPEYEGDQPKFGKSIKDTDEAVKNGTAILYEPAFTHNGVFAAMDIMVRDQGAWKVYEVKSSASVKDQYVTDAALQHWVITGSGLEVSDFSIVHIDTSYMRKGELDLPKLFRAESVLEAIKPMQEDIGENIARLQAVLELKREPKKPIGPHCFDPYTCSFKGYCWPKLPKPSVFDVGRLGAKAWELFNSKIAAAADIPSEFPLSENQRIEVDSAISGKPHIDAGAIRAFVADLGKPLYFFDFETMSPGVPILDRTSPFEAVPFQYSLHFRAGQGATLSHTAFLGDASTDPRLALVDQFLSDTQAPGRIVVYSSYEKTHLQGLARHFPDRGAEIQKRIDRLADLSIPFRDHLYYASSMNGSYSIKTVLPALVPGLSYDGMVINEGQAASRAYEALHAETDQEKIALVRKALLDYCGLDTLAMVKLLEVLEAI